MYERTDKRRLYQLIEMYLSKKIDEDSFATDLIYSYGQELDYDTLEKEEYETFSNLVRIASRFSDIEEDLQKYPGVYYTKEELKKTIIESKHHLEKYFKKLQENGELGAELDEV